MSRTSLGFYPSDIIIQKKYKINGNGIASSADHEIICQDKKHQYVLRLAEYAGYWAYGYNTMVRACPTCGTGGGTAGPSFSVLLHAGHDINYKYNYDAWIKNCPLFKTREEAREAGIKELIEKLESNSTYHFDTSQPKCSAYKKLKRQCLEKLKPQLQLF